MQNVVPASDLLNHKPRGWGPGLTNSPGDSPALKFENYCPLMLFMCGPGQPASNLEACYKYRISGPTLDLLDQNLHFQEILGSLYVC